jgi:hypothetical protein
MLGHGFGHGDARPFAFHDSERDAVHEKYDIRTPRIGGMLALNVKLRADVELVSLGMRPVDKPDLEGAGDAIDGLLDGSPEQQEIGEFLVDAQESRGTGPLQSLHRFGETVLGEGGAAASLFDSIDTGQALFQDTVEEDIGPSATTLSMGLFAREKPPRGLHLLEKMQGRKL